MWSYRMDLASATSFADTKWSFSCFVHFCRPLNKYDSGEVGAMLDTHSFPIVIDYLIFIRAKSITGVST